MNDNMAERYDKITEAQFNSQFLLDALKLSYSKPMFFLFYLILLWALRYKLYPRKSLVTFTLLVKGLGWYITVILHARRCNFIKSINLKNFLAHFTCSKG